MQSGLQVASMSGPDVPPEEVYHPHETKQPEPIFILTVLHGAFNNCDDFTEVDEINNFFYKTQNFPGTLKG